MKLHNQKILITGGAGFIGSHLSMALCKTNSVTVLDSFDSPVMTKKELESSGIRVVRGNILNPKDISSAMNGNTIVFHLAVACVRLSLQNPVCVHEVNATGTLHVLLAAKKETVQRFVYVSSSEVYGTAKSPRMSEAHPTDPTTVYGTSKLIGEQYTHYFYAHEKVPSTIVRPFNTYGPRSHFDGVYGEVIPRFVIRALTQNQPVIFGKGNQSRDFTYVDDTVRGIILSSESDDLIGQTVNIARGKEVSILSLAKTINQILNIPFQPIFKSARPNDVFRHAADISKTKKFLHFSPNTSLSKGLTAYMRYLRKTYPDPTKLLKLIPEKNW